MKKKLLSAILATGLFFCTVTARADLFILEGNFSSADEIFLGEFYLAGDYFTTPGLEHISAGRFDLFTESSRPLGYFNTFASFDTYLVLWDSDGNMVAYNDDQYFSPDARIFGEYWRAPGSVCVPEGCLPAHYGYLSGTYYFTLSSADYVPAGTNIADGYTYIGPKGDGSGSWSEDKTYWKLAIRGDVTSFNGVSGIPGIPNIPGIPSSIPEPETWAMLLAGLGIMGAVTRRRRATA